MSDEGRRRRLPTCDETDGQLVDRVRAGSTESFAHLYERHAGAVRRAISDNVHDPEHQRDLVQETFTRALSKLDTLREVSQFRPWVLQIARNAAIDDLRTRTLVRLEPIDDDQRLPPSADAGPEVIAEVRALAASVEAGVATLSARDAAAVAMVAHLGFGPAEVASALGITQGNAKVVLHRARARLRMALVAASDQREVSGS